MQQDIEMSLINVCVLLSTVALAGPPAGRTGAVIPNDADAPYIATFHRDSKTLTYVAASHHSQKQYPNAFQDPVFKTVADAFQQSKPAAVIVEGVDPSDMGPFHQYAEKCAASNYAGMYCGESAYVAHLAIQAGAQVYTGEPSAASVLAYFEAHGYTVEDYFGYIAIRQIPFAKRQTDADFAQVLQALVRQQNRLLGTSIQFSIETFAQWYAKHMEIPQNYMDLTTEDSSPYVTPGAPTTIFHKMSALNEEARDANIVQTVETALSQNGTVLIVYGASHLTFEWKQLNALMGLPVKRKPF